jgi:hypothetical protein
MRGTDRRITSSYAVRQIGASELSLVEVSGRFK